MHLFLIGLLNLLMKLMGRPDRDLLLLALETAAYDTVKAKLSQFVHAELCLSKKIDRVKPANAPVSTLKWVNSHHLHPP